MRLHSITTQPNTPTTRHPQMPVGGFIIDDQGREVAITEQMIQQACAALEDSRQASQQLA